jgi:hypothetical protein
LGQRHRHGYANRAQGHVAGSKVMAMTMIDL